MGDRSIEAPDEEAALVLAVWRYFREETGYRKTADVALDAWVALRTGPTQPRGSQGEARKGPPTDARTSTGSH